MNALLEMTKSLQTIVQRAHEAGIDAVEDTKGSLHDFKQQKASYLISMIGKQTNDLTEALSKQAKQVDDVRLQEFCDLDEETNIHVLQSRLQQLSDHLATMKLDAPLDPDIAFSLHVHIPKEIRDDIQLDLKELNKCFAANCLRSAVIICGRLLETALHRKYFEITGRDILEKNPGIGLGKLIAKLSEKNVSFDPGLTQQIHLINQVRIFSVHKKQEAFYPSPAQAKAMILYTTDTLEKIFTK